MSYRNALPREAQMRALLREVDDRLGMLEDRKQPPPLVQEAGIEGQAAVWDTATGTYVAGPVDPTTGIAPGPSIRVISNVNVSHATGVYTDIPFNFVTWDTTGGFMWDATQPTRISFIAAGKYHVWWNFAWGPSAGTYRAAKIHVNGSVAAATGTAIGFFLGPPVAAQGCFSNIITEYAFVPGDFITFGLTHDVGANTNAILHAAGATRQAA